MLNYDSILIRFGELSTKGKNKKDFVVQLYKNVKTALQDFKGLSFNRSHDRIYVKLNDEDPTSVADILKDVSGIANFSFVYKVNESLDDIKKATLELVLKQGGKTFKVDTKRANKSFPIHSDDMNRHIAGNILASTDLKVDVHNPDILVKVEIRQEGTFVYTSKIQGAGGYPLGVGGKAMLLMSGGIDSPVAAYLMMKRGVKIEAIHFASPPYTSPQAVDKVKDLLYVLSKYRCPIKLHIVPFTKLQEKIYEVCDESYAITIMRRMMYRIAERVAKNRNCTALVSGESVGQVASQTLESMATINEVIKLPMIRPLAVMDKVEIIAIAEKIKTFEISIRPFIDCCTIFNPVSPVTKPRVHIAKEMEERFDYEQLVYDCVNEIETITIDANVQEESEIDKFF